MAREQSYPRTALRSAKAGLFRNVVAANAAYPLHANCRQSVRSARAPRAGAGARHHPPGERIRSRRRVARQRPRPDAAHPLHRARAGAARRHDLPARRADQRPAIQHDPWLGASRAIWSTISAAPTCSPSPPTMPARTMRANGSPITATRARASTDVVDWVELIPFSETRNYVQRVHGKRASLSLPAGGRADADHAGSGFAAGAVRLERRFNRTATS